MKRCPRCNQEFTEDWLTFCTSDGTPLTDAERSTADPPPTIAMPQPPVTTRQEERPTWRMPADPGFGGPLGRPQQPQPIAPVWQPPPPPYVQGPSKGLATAAMITGILSITVGLFCFGPVPAVVAIVLGCVALSQMKRSPEQVGGGPFAWIGIVTGCLTLLFYIGFYIIMLIIGLSR